jgi:hypothetical protein
VNLDTAKIVTAKISNKREIGGGLHGRSRTGGRVRQRQRRVSRWQRLRAGEQWQLRGGGGQAGGGTARGQPGDAAGSRAAGAGSSVVATGRCWSPRER